MVYNLRHAVPLSDQITRCSHAMRTDRILSSEYGKFRPEIQDYFRKKVLKSPMRIYDPTAGTAPLIPFIEVEGHTAYFNDVLPIHCFINMAKTYRVFQCYEQHGYDWLLEQLCYCMAPLEHEPLHISDKWIADGVLNCLILAWKSADRYEADVATLLRAAVLASVRPLSSITRSGNPTWFKFGGISSTKGFREVAAERLARFGRYYAHNYDSSRVKELGQCFFSAKEAVELRLPHKVDLILTSPPYCNRLEPTVQYGPENYFLSALGYGVPESSIIGTTKVRDYGTLAEDFERLTSISKYASSLLNSIRRSRTPDDPSYYLKYYTRYFAMLVGTTESALHHLSRTGKMYVVTQDNTHRGQLIEIDTILRESLRDKGWNVRVVRKWQRHHLGLRNVSREHAFVRPKHFEKILLVWR